MALSALRVAKILHGCHCSLLLSLSSIHIAATDQTIEKSIERAVATKSYQQIPDLLNTLKASHHNPNAFSFLSAIPLTNRDQLIDEILQSFISLRFGNRAKPVYDSLLSFTLQSSHPFPVALAVLQRTLRSGCSPDPQIQLLLSSAWLTQRHQSQSISNMLLNVRSIGYRPDCGTCNYLISSLCAVDQLQEATQVLRGMERAMCIPDLDSYSPIIAKMCSFRKTRDAMALLTEMVKEHRLSPRQGILVKLAASLRANREIWQAATMIELLEKEGFHVGFECYELVVEGCLECEEFILAGKVAMLMTEKGFIPFINIRKKVFDGLACVGEWDLACAVRRRFAKLCS